MRRRAESIAEGQAHGEGLVFPVAVREGEADGLVTEGEAQVFEPEHGLDIQAEAVTPTAETNSQGSPLPARVQSALLMTPMEE